MLYCLHTKCPSQSVEEGQGQGAGCEDGFSLVVPDIVMYLQEGFKLGPCTWPEVPLEPGGRSPISARGLSHGLDGDPPHREGSAGDLRAENLFFPLLQKDVFPQLPPFSKGIDDFQTPSVLEINILTPLSPFICSSSLRPADWFFGKIHFLYLPLLPLLPSGPELQHGPQC